MIVFTVMQFLIIFIVNLLIPFVITYVTTPYLIKRLSERNIIGLDLHRNVNIATGGGIAILISFSSGIVLDGILNINHKAMLMMLLIALLSFIIGLLDDILELSRKTLIMLSLFTGVPFLSYQVGSTIITLTPFGPIDLGILFWPIAVLIVSFLSNAVNIYAGFNGLETGLGLISSLSLAICSILYGSIETTIVLLTLSATLAAFLKYNFYPAKIFIGNSGTYMIGAVIASAVIVGTIKTTGLIACFPYVINFIIRLYNKMKWTVGEVTQDGKVYCKKFYALWCIFMYKNPTDERKLVIRCWTLQTLFGLIAILYAIIVNYMV